MHRGILDIQVLHIVRTPNDYRGMQGHSLEDAFGGGGKPHPKAKKYETVPETPGRLSCL